MSEVKMTETITVAQISKYGVRVGDSWYNLNHPLQPANFLPNTTYTVGIRVSKTGKKYISEIIQSESPKEIPDPVVVNPDPERTQRVINAVKGPSVSTGDPDKDRRIQRQGCYQAALQSSFPVTLSTNVEEYLAFVRRLAEEGVKFVNEK